MINDISYKTLIGPKHFGIRLDKIDEFIRIYDGTRYLALVGSEHYDGIYKKIRYFASLKSSIKYIFSQYFTIIKIDFYDSLPIEKRLTLHNFVILIKSVLNKDKNYYYYKIILEKCSHHCKKKQLKLGMLILII